MHRSLLIMAAAAALTIAAPISASTGSVLVRDAHSASVVKTGSFVTRQNDDDDLEYGGTPFAKRDDDDEDLEMGATPFGKRQDDSDEDLEMGATPFGKRQDDDDEDLEMGGTPFSKRQDSDEDLEMGGTPFGKRGVYDKVDIEGFRRNHLGQLPPTDAASEA